VNVKVLYFASFREHLGLDEETRALPDGAQVHELWESLVRQVPHFAAFPSMPPAAVNREYTGASTVLRDGDEVAFLPPVAGG
jgi:molybdopterin converting factor subunit 1